VVVEPRRVQDAHLGLDNGHLTRAPGFACQGDALATHVHGAGRDVELDVELDMGETAEKELVSVAIINEIVGPGTQ
jgi:hypothetical protein